MRKSQKGRIITWGDKISKAKMGHPVSFDTRKKISLILKGRKLPKEVREKMSKSNLGRKVSEETRKKISNANLGRKYSEEHKRKLSMAHKGKTIASKGVSRLWMRGSNNHNWKGGTYGTERSCLMGRVEYKLWRESVFKRDNYTCIWCGQKGGKLNADHIQLWKDFPELRFAIDNGRTLCVGCHKKRHIKVAIKTKL